MSHKPDYWTSNFTTSTDDSDQITNTVYENVLEKRSKYERNSKMFLQNYRMYKIKIENALETYRNEIRDFSVLIEKCRNYVEEPINEKIKKSKNVVHETYKIELKRNENQELCDNCKYLELYIPIFEKIYWNIFKIFESIDIIIQNDFETALELLQEIMIKFEEIENDYQSETIIRHTSYDDNIHRFLYRRTLLNKTISKSLLKYVQEIIDD
jgi:hypothetical protein